DGTVGPAPVAQAPADARAVPVAAAETALVCPVPAKLDQPDVGDDEFSSTPVATRSRLAAAVLGADGTPELATPGGGAAEELVGPLETGGEAAVVAGDLPGPRLLRVTPGGATYAAGTVTSVTTGGDLRGMIARPCTQPADEHWPVGAGTAVRSAGRVRQPDP